MKETEITNKTKHPFPIVYKRVYKKTLYESSRKYEKVAATSLNACIFLLSHKINSSSRWHAEFTAIDKQ